MTTVETAAPEDTILDVLTLGFVADPIMRWLYPGSDTYLKHFRTLLMRFGGVAFDHQAAFKVRGENAAALWLPPNAHPDEAGLVAHFEAVLPPRVLEDALVVLEKIDAISPREPFWHLAFVASDPLAQGRGYGSSLVNHVLTRCDADRTVAYLENTNPANTPFYRKHGFEVIGEMQAGKSPPIAAMRREPR